ncbi:MAG: sodium/glutamate symporter [Stackebrandtia sp.]
MSPETVGLALLLLGLLLLIAKLIRVRWKFAQKLFLPSSIIGGGIALLFGPEIFGSIMSAFGNDSYTEGGLFGAEVREVWTSLPGLLISVVFAALFLGERLPKPKQAAKLAGPQLAFGLTLGAGQYVIGLLLALLVITPFFDLPYAVGTLIEVGFEGGHGTAAGMQGTFEELGFEEGKDLSLGMATVGLLTGVVVGIALVNWGVRTGKASQLDAGRTNMSVKEAQGVYEKDEHRPAAMMTVNPSSIEPLIFHFGMIAAAVLIGQLMLMGMQKVEQLLWADSVEILAYVPLFPMAMIGGIFVQMIIDRFDRGGLVDRLTMERLQGFALDLLVIAAMGTLALEVIADNFWPFLILAVAGLAWCVFAVVFLAKRIIPEYWFERSLGDFGQSTGTTATGLVLMRIADPELRTPAYQAFGYKQLILEPFFGGGIVTAASVPLIVQFGPTPFLISMIVLLIAAVGLGMFFRNRSVKRARQQELVKT